MCREDEVGVFARRLLPADGAAALRHRLGPGAAARACGVIDGPFAVSAMALGSSSCCSAITWRTGAQLIESLDARTATERALSESERTVREADRQKTEFLATLSHELRNPLAPIRFAVELLKTPGAAAERARQTIDRQVRHLTRLIDDLLDLTRITGGKLELHPRPCDLRQLVQDAAEAVGGEIARLRHRLTIDLPRAAGVAAGRSRSRDPDAGEPAHQRRPLQRARRVDRRAAPSWTTPTSPSSCAIPVTGSTRRTWNACSSGSCSSSRSARADWASGWRW